VVHLREDLPRVVAVLPLEGIVNVRHLVLPRGQNRVSHFFVGAVALGVGSVGCQMHRLPVGQVLRVVAQAAVHGRQARVARLVVPVVGLVLERLHQVFVLQEAVHGRVNGPKRRFNGGPRFKHVPRPIGHFAQGPRQDFLELGDPNLVRIDARLEKHQRYTHTAKQGTDSRVKALLLPHHHEMSRLGATECLLIASVGTRIRTERKSPPRTLSPSRSSPPPLSGAYIPVPSPLGPLRRW